MRESFVAAIISATAILCGAAIGGVCSWLVSKNNTNRNIEVQNRIVQENRIIEDKIRRKNLCQYSNIIRLDICTAIFQSIRSLKQFKEPKGKKYPIYIPVNKEYSRAIASLTGIFNLKEMSYIYQLYGIIEKINYDVKKLNYTAINEYESARIDYEIFLEKLYGDNLIHILNIGVDELTYNQLINNKFIKQGYRVVLEKLDKACEFLED